MKNIGKIHILFLLIVSCLVFAGWADNWKGVKESAKKIKTIRAHFVQEKHMKILSRPLISKGEMLYQADDSLRWEYSSPVKSVLLMYKGNIKRYIKQGNSFENDSSSNLQAMRIVLQEITMWLNGRFDGNPNFSARLVSKGIKKIILTPKEKSFSRFIKRIELRLSKKPGVIGQVKIIEGRGNYTLLKFRGVRINKAISKKLFQEI